jgi:hypothetical protein
VSTTVEAADQGRGLPMRVGNLGFLIDKLGRDAGPLQFLRELTQNSLQAIGATPTRSGRVLWDVDWNRHTLTEGRVYKLACIDTGIGMTGPEMIEYINQFSASMHEQDYDKNFGIGAKIAAATKNPAGLVYLSWKDGKGAMTHLWRNPETRQYELQPFDLPNGDVQYWLPISNEIKPDEIEQHGTMVVLLGESETGNTLDAPASAASPSRWIGRHLNTRYYEFPPGIEVRAREGWTFPRSDRDRNTTREVTGQRPYLAKHAQSSGTVALDALESGCRALAHWWILRNESALDSNSGFIASSGHTAALYQRELYEMATGRAGVARLQLFGVIFGYKRVVIYVEPLNDAGADVLPDTARQRLLHQDASLPWEEWAAEFRAPAKMPSEIIDLMHEVTRDSDSSEDMDAIKERLKRVSDLLRLSRYRPARSGDLTASDETIGGAARDGTGRRSGTGGAGGGRGGRGGDLYALWVDPDGVAAEEVQVDNLPDVKWVSVRDGTRTPPFLEDRAAKFLPELNLLQINGDFRGFTDMVERWYERYGEQPATLPVIVHVVREWFQQGLIETVLGTQSLQGSREWNPDDIAKALSEEALTASVMQRYHVDNSISRAIGSKLGTLKERFAA